MFRFAQHDSFVHVVSSRQFSWHYHFSWVGLATGSPQAPTRRTGRLADDLWEWRAKHAITIRRRQIEWSDPAGDAIGSAEY